MSQERFTELLRADLAVNRGLSRVTVVAFRVRSRAYQAALPVRVLLSPLLLAAWWWTAISMGADIPPSVQAGGGLRLPHGGRGLVLHPNTQLGRNVTLYHRVTIGVRGSATRCPRLGDGVYVGTGASLLGDIEIGERARIGAGAVLIRDLSAGETYVGLPR